jgi:GNAT superfamily N-acetyltransferase
MPYERRNGDFVLTTDRTRIDVSTVESFLRGTYWAANRTRERIARTLETSLCFIVLRAVDNRPVAFTRVVSDYADFAWVCDVVVDDAFRGRGIGTWMISCVLEHPDLVGLRRIILATSNAHGLYARYGFKPLENPAIWMERA